MKSYQGACKQCWKKKEYKEAVSKLKDGTSLSCRHGVYDPKKNIMLELKR